MLPHVRLARPLRPILLALVLPVVASLGGCDHHEQEDHGVDDHHAEEGGSLELGPPTATVCPEGSTLTYEGFGRPFMESYCLRCHSASVTGAAREGAPSDHNFDTPIELQGLADHIDRMAGVGPEATNEIMPVGDPQPTLEERQQLAEWLACGAP